jgi:thymidylate synthase (FAD)
MNKYERIISVLDHGHVQYVDHMGSDERITEAARVSYSGGSKGAEADKKLLIRLYRDGHTSPFEMCKLVLRIKMPIFVARQYIRHRMQNVNEVSARYTELPKEFYLPTNWRQQGDAKDKQTSVDPGDWNPNVPHSPFRVFGQKHTATAELTAACESAYQVYEALLKAGVAREMARMVLPLNIYTEMFVCWDLKNLIHFLRLRDDPHAQWEHQQYGKAIKAICTDLFPWTMEAYHQFKWVYKDTTIGSEE